MALNFKKVLFLGSDAISTATLKTFLNHITQKSEIPNLIQVLAPPWAKPRTPLADFYSLCEKEQIKVNVFPKAVDKAHKAKLWDEVVQLVTQN